jgi:hypothetical protein
LVCVRQGKHKDRVGLIVATFTGGSIEVFDVSTYFLSFFSLY